MRRIDFWLPSIIGFFLTPLFIFLLPYTISAGASHAGAGMGQLLILYPIPMWLMLSRPVSDDSLITPVFAFLLGLVQFPLYGFVISYARLSKRWWAIIPAAFVGLHLLVIAAAIVVFTIQAVLG